MRLPCPRPAARRIVGVLLLALWLGQWSLLAHSIAHALPSAMAVAASDTDTAWGHDAGTTACHLVDHLLLGQAPGGQPPSVACLPAAVLRLSAPAASAAPGPVAAAYDARGPPRA